LVDAHQTGILYTSCKRWKQRKNSVVVGVFVMPDKKNDKGTTQKKDTDKDKAGGKSGGKTDKGSKKK
jgi:hypothetical protein